MIFTPVTSMMDYGQMDGAGIGAALGSGMRKNKLAKLMGAVDGAADDPSREQAFQQLGAFDPESGKIARNEYETEQEELLDKVGKGARYLKSALASGDKAAAQGAWSAVRPYMAKIAMANGGTEPPADLSDDFVQAMMPNLEKVIAMTGGMEANKGTEGRVVGNALVDPYTGKVLYQGERQQNRVLVKDTQGNYFSVDPADPGNATPVQIGGGSPVPQVGAANPQQAYRDAIAGIESAGSGDYSALGPVTKSGDRAYGRYQVMGANIPQWTQAALGRSMTPQEFVANPQAQDATFDHRFGSYAKKYGPEGAARAWFAGEGGMNKPGARDVLGTSVSEYGSRFAQSLGGGRQLRGESNAKPAGEESFGQPQEVIGTDGKPRLVQFGNRGGRREVSGYGAKPSTKSGGGVSLPVSAQRVDDEIQGKIETLGQLADVVKLHADRLADGRLKVSPANAALARGRELVGMATDNDTNLIQLKADLKEFVNSKLNQAKGPQTDQDAKRAFDAVMNSNDPKVIAQSLARIANWIKRESNAQVSRRNLLYRNNGLGGAASPSKKPTPAGGDISDLLTKYGGS